MQEESSQNLRQIFLYVENDKVLSADLKMGLQRSNISVHDFNNYDSALKWLYMNRHHPVDAIVIDIPDVRLQQNLNAFKLCQAIRRGISIPSLQMHFEGWGHDVPIVMLGAESQWRQIEDKLDQLQISHERLQLKPFPVQSLLNKLHGLLVRAEDHVVESRSSTIYIRSLAIDVKRQSATLAGQPLNLAPIEFGLLLYLAQHSDQAVDKRELVEDIWGLRGAKATEMVNGNTVNQHIANLRQKLKGSGFSLGLNFVDELDEAFISSALRAKIREGGLDLAARARIVIVKPGEIWTLVDDARAYRIEKVKIKRRKNKEEKNENEENEIYVYYSDCCDLIGRGSQGSYILQTNRNVNDMKIEQDDTELTEPELVELKDSGAARLILVTSDPDLPKEFLLQDVPACDAENRGIQIGRSRQCNYVLDDKRISRVHAMICLSERKFHLIDTGSKGHTFLEGSTRPRVMLTPKKEYILENGDIIYFNTVGYKFETFSS
ncbi:MAG: FHA domain-containing protein [Bdellovibrionales bacterium]|nr:FHA domain-containing protein [Bdellovibrionales bacterium]